MGAPEEEAERLRRQIADIAAGPTVPAGPMDFSQFAGQRLPPAQVAQQQQAQGLRGAATQAPAAPGNLVVARPTGTPAPAAPTTANPQALAPESNAAAGPLDLAMQELMRPSSGGGPRVTNVRTATTNAPVSAETAAGLGENQDAIRAALTDRSQTMAAGQGAQAGTFEQSVQQSQGEAQRQQLQAQQDAQAQQQQVQHADAINQQVLDGKIDPNRVLGDAFSGGRIAAAIGLFISGLANGQSGADAFLAQINQTIDRDIAAQEANLANLRAGAQNQQNLVGLYRQVNQDEEAARQAARATMLQSVAQRLQAQQSRLGQDMQRPELALTLAQLEQARLQAQAAAEAGRWQNIQTMRTASGGPGGGPDYRRAAALQSLGLARGTVVGHDANRVAEAARHSATAGPGPDAERLALVGNRPGVRIAPGSAGQPVPPMAVAAPILKRIGNTEEVVALQRQAAALREQRNSTANPLEIARISNELDLLGTQAMTLAGQMRDAGSMTTHDQEVFRNLTAIASGYNPSQAIRDPELVLLQRAARMNEESLGRDYASLGLERPTATTADAVIRYQ